MFNHQPSSDLNCELEESADKLSDIVRLQSAIKMADESWEACAPHQRALLSSMGVSYLHDLDLTQLVTDLQVEVPRSYGYLIDEFKESIDSGNTAAEAAADIPGLLPLRAALSLHLLEDDQQCKSFFNRFVDQTHAIENRLDPRQQIVWQLIRNGLIYLFVFGVFIFINVNILPEIKDIFEEYGMNLPRSFYWLVFINRNFVFAFMGCLLLLAVLSPILIRYLVEALRGLNLHFWKTQPSSVATQKRKVLSQLISPNRYREELPGAINRILSLPVLRNETDFKSLTEARALVLSDFENQAVEQAASPEMRAWLLSHFADRYEHAYRYQSVWLIKALMSFFNIVMGLFVFLTALAIFTCLLRMIEGLNEW
ncbi:MAG: hypothetical protein AAGA30_00115 [Planctomycetota bacterium]